MINFPKIYKMRIVLRADENAKRKNVFYAIRSMVLASGLPYEPAKVNKNWPRLVFGPTCALSQYAEREYLDIYLRESVPVEQVRQSLERSKPAEITLLEVSRVPYAMPAVADLAAAVKYRAEGNFSAFGTEQTLENYFNADHVEVVRRAENGLTLTFDVKPLVLEAQTENASVLHLTLAGKNGKWLNPYVAIGAWLGLTIPLPDDTFTISGIKMVREGLYWQDTNGSLHLI
jgi:radical SAM-linked protein